MLPYAWGMDRSYWEHFEHIADVGIRGVGATCTDAFVQGALALTAALVKPETVEAQTAVPITCQESDRDYLFFAWLNALLFEMDTRAMLFSRFDVTLTPGGLNAQAWGESIDPSRHQPAVQVKAATLAELAVYERSDGLWVAQCVVDV